ncbi:MAG TPA: hypothetical protein VEH06_00100 [Candidatus Bathyarchaeia archaeon]|nr:hypothetical protein [Candidatus Bathyarchaeia archaeon]
MYSKGPPTTPSDPLRSYFIILENVLGVNPPRHTGIGFLDWFKFYNVIAPYLF